MHFVCLVCASGEHFLFATMGTNDPLQSGSRWGMLYKLKVSRHKRRISLDQLAVNMKVKLHSCANGNFGEKSLELTQARSRSWIIFSNMVCTSYANFIKKTNRAVI